MIINILLLFSFLFSVYCTGFCITHRWFFDMPNVLKIIGIVLVGMLLSVPILYFFSILFRFTNDPISYAILAYSIVIAMTVWLEYKKKPYVTLRYLRDAIRIEKDEFPILIFSVLFSTYIMFKTFRMGTGSTLLIGSNEVFDFGHALSIIRSFSWGNNVPFASPFVAGTPHMYHFMFYFFVGILEHIGVPLVWAMNIPSIFTFSSMLVVMYFLPQLIFKKSSLLGWITVLLTVTHSTLTFLFIFIQKGISLQTIIDIWRLPKYLFASPYDNSLISIFWTLNVFVNQRHLAIGIVAVLYLYFALIVKLMKRSNLSYSFTCLCAVTIGFLILWHMMMALAGLCIIGSLFFLQKRWKHLMIFFLITASIWIVCLSPWLPVILTFGKELVQKKSVGILPSSGVSFQPFTWGVVNLGISIFTVPFGIILHRFKMHLWFPFLMLTIISVCISLAMGSQLHQKFVNIWILYANIFSAVFLLWLWDRKIFGKLLAIVSFIFLVGSGVIDGMVIKNDFMYPVQDASDNPLIQWIQSETPKNSVFLSYGDIFDPITLAGRSNYFGFYRHIGQPNRSEAVLKIFEAQTPPDFSFASSLGINYIMMPKWKKSDFAYAITPDMWRKNFPVLYEDEKHIIFLVR